MRTYFPILVLYVDTNEKVVCSSPDDIACRCAFKVLKTNYGQPMEIPDES
jgi:hypothetical protein